MAAKLSKATREAISRGQAERHRRQREELGIDPLPTKKCSREDCDRAGEWLRVPEDFSMRTRKLADGTKRKYPSGECKRCARKRAEKWKQDFIAEHGEEAYKAKWKTWNSKRDADHKRRYDREYQRFLRASQGVEPRGPWKKYRAELERRSETPVPAEPFRDWWRELQPITKSKIFGLNDNYPRQIYRVFNEQDNVSLYTVDTFGTLAGQPGLASTLYPDA